MNKPIYPYPRPKNVPSASLLLVPLLIGGAIALILFADGCMGFKASTAATVNNDITSVIAGAGAAANQAETDYQNKVIAQTPTARNAINNLGAAYEQARAAYLVMLTAEEAYQSAEKAQLNVCSPPPANIASQSNCPPATQATTAALAKFQTTQAALNSAVANLANQTKAVQALKK